MPITSYTHTHPFNSPLSRTTGVGRYQKGKTNLDFSEAKDSEWQWHQLGHMQVCTSLQTDNHASNPTAQFFTGRMPFLPPNQQRQSTECIQLPVISIQSRFATDTDRHRTQGHRLSGRVRCIVHTQQPWAPPGRGKGGHLTPGFRHKFFPYHYSCT